jgi:DNA-binding MarR family transcriptional regulator
MSSRDTDRFKERVARVKQAMESQKHFLLEDYKGIATIRQIQKQTGLNNQAVKRIVKALEDQGEVKVIKDRSEIVLLK